MNNDTSISFIGFQPNKERLSTLLLDSELSTLDFSIFFSEDQKYESSYSFSSSSQQFWRNSVSKIREGLLRNLELRSPGLNLDRSLNYPWMDPRPLKKGDLSVLSKHCRALLRFLDSDKRYLVVFEDDIIFHPGWFNYLNSVLTEVSFDYLDLAGGDGITPECATLYGTSFNLFRDYLSATRTACAYVVNRRVASCLLEHLFNPILPIDWAISAALSDISNPLVYWSCDPFFEHGSCTGKFTSWRSS